NARERVAAVWNDDRRAGVREAFARVEQPWAIGLAGEVEGGLDRWAESWAAMHRQTCEASALGEQSDTMLDRRMLCLDRRLAEFAELVEVVTGAEVQSYERVGEAVSKLPELGTCEAAAIEAGLDFFMSGGEAGDHGELHRLAIAEHERELFRANSLEMTGAFA